MLDDRVRIWQISDVQLKLDGVTPTLVELMKGSHRPK